MIKARIRWCTCRVENILTLGKLLILWFCFLLHSILFLISQISYRTYKIISSYELARHVMETIFSSWNDCENWSGPSTGLDSCALPMKMSWLHHCTRPYRRLTRNVSQNFYYERVWHRDYMVGSVNTRPFTDCW